METKVTTETTTKVNVSIESETPQAIDDKVTPKGKGKLDMVSSMTTRICASELSHSVTIATWRTARCSGMPINAFL